MKLRIASLGERDLHFVADFGCPLKVKFVDSKKVNAWADGTQVVITSAILARCDSDADLAFVLAHEMAHNLLHHRQRLALAGIQRSGLLPIPSAASAMVRETEEEADRLAVRLTAASGYDVSQAVSFLDRLLNSGNGVHRAAATHPDAPRRLMLLSAAIADLAGI